MLDTFKDSQGYSLDTDLTADDWVDLVGKYKEAVARETGSDFPQDAHAQLWGAIGAVFSSWMNARAVTYRKLHDIPESWGTAVNVQAMVFGNMGETSATGVAFTRNPSTGVKELYGEYLMNAQGEDVVAGLRTPQPLTEVASRASPGEKISLEAAMPRIFSEPWPFIGPWKNRARMPTTFSLWAPGFTAAGPGRTGMRSDTYDSIPILRFFTARKLSCRFSGIS